MESAPESGQQPDAELALRARGGDREAYAVLYNRYFQGIYDFAFRTVRDPAKAADVVQNTFIKAWQSMKRGSGGESFKAWLFTIARNNAIDELRHYKRLVSTGAGGDGESGGLPAYAEVDNTRLADAQAVVQDKELVDLVWNSAAALSPNDYTLLDLHVRQGLSADELATTLSITRDNAYQRLFRLRNALADAVTSALLMRRGRRDCSNLATLLARVGSLEVTPAVQQLIEGHVKECPACQESKRRFASPVEIFGSFTVLPAAAGFQEAIWDRVCGRLQSRAGLRDRWAQASRATKIIVGANAAALLAALIATVLILAPGGGGGGPVQDPGDVHSTSHQIGEPSNDNVITVSWSQQPDAAGFSFLFSEEPAELPDTDADLRGEAISARSLPLDQGSWYFHMRTMGKDGEWTSTVHIGPFEISEGDPEPSDTPTPTPGDTETPTATPGASPTPTATAEATPTATPKATPKPTPKPTPTASPPPATCPPAEGQDADSDGYCDQEEVLHGSNPNDPFSTPEDLAVPGKCSDGVDNDRDDRTDAEDPGCLA